MEVSKIHLSQAESELMQNADIILTKNSVLQKMKNLLEEVQQMQSDFVKERQISKALIFRTTPKISRGENYLGLPWLILDYPRSSEGDLFFIRTMFWWGRFFSTTLHVSGNHKRSVVQAVSLSRNTLQGFSVGINEDPWMHHFEEDNYRAIESMSATGFDEACLRTQHLKIAKMFPLKEWQRAPAILFESWKLLLEVSGSVS
jgi:hypothetical protein